MNCIIATTSVLRVSATFADNIMGRDVTICTGSRQSTSTNIIIAMVRRCEVDAILSNIELCNLFVDAYLEI